MIKRNEHIAYNLKKLRANILSGKVTEKNIVKEAKKVFTKKRLLTPEIIEETPKSEQGKVEYKLSSFKKHKPVLNALSDELNLSNGDVKSDLQQVFNYLNAGVNVQFPNMKKHLVKDVSKTRANINAMISNI